MKAVDNLKEYIAEDKIYQDWCNGHTSYVSDFDRFCINHVKDIKEVIDKLERVNKAIDKLICWGEALDPVFQKEMLEILENK